jgi:amidase
MDPSPATAHIAELDVRALLETIVSGHLSSTESVECYLQRIEEIDKSGPTLHAVIETNPDAISIAKRLDAERAEGRLRSPLHGIPVLLKDNIDTADRLLTTAGSMALTANRPFVDAPLVTRLRQAGVIILGKANMSEWANFRSTRPLSGWSARGGLCLNPHALDRTAGGSSSGCAAGVAAGLAPLAVGTETVGSIVCPASLCGVVGIKPTVGLVTRAGIVPISHTQDTAGPLARTVFDAALLLGELAGSDPSDEVTFAPDRIVHADYTRYCTLDGVRGLRVGLPRTGLWGYHEQADTWAEAAVRALATHGVDVVDPANLPSAVELVDLDDDLVVLTTEFKAGIKAYLSRRGPGTPKDLGELIEFNEAHANVELQYFGQERFEQAVRSPGLDDLRYRAALETCRRLGRTDGIDAALQTHDLDALVMPAYPPADKVNFMEDGRYGGGSCSRPSAMAGYPQVTVPCGTIDGLPVGIAFAGTAWSEPTLIKLAYVVEQALRRDLRPEYRPPQPD